MAVITEIVFLDVGWLERAEVRGAVMRRNATVRTYVILGEYDDPNARR
ncbi:hypothetical protein AKJ09_05025 [Labilithrix luteola]|uniref:Uncharacterized protein n=1 Tax=Labilithrix luteola TaxID=1391654 RepID=A0A0K1PYA6_9BACT|nr:hypothetical protein AKJ09_05025 [Labilithrix luteola]